ncbi:Uncharacterized protein Rs2_02765 [Raphanus sativus]|nr:Uncharacterized protein Rs2_02765 [Raphanus sativus]
MEVETIKREGETFRALRRTSMEVSRDVSTELIQCRVSTMGFIEIHMFSGDDLRPWIDWMENRFALEDFTDDQRMTLAYAVIRGEAGLGTKIEYRIAASFSKLERPQGCDVVAVWKP